MQHIFAAALLLFILSDGAAHADTAFPGVSASGGFGVSGPEEEYVYTTKDLALDLVSPLVAYKVVTLVLKEKLNPALDASIAIATVAAVWAVLSDATWLD